MTGKDLRRMHPAVFVDLARVPNPNAAIQAAGGDKFSIRAERGTVYPVGMRRQREQSLAGCGVPNFCRAIETCRHDSTPGLVERRGLNKTFMARERHTTRRIRVQRPDSRQAVI